MIKPGTKNCLTETKCHLSPQPETKIRFTQGWQKHPNSGENLPLTDISNITKCCPNFHQISVWPFQCHSHCKCLSQLRRNFASVGQIFISGARWISQKTPYMTKHEYGISKNICHYKKRTIVSSWTTTGIQIIVSILPIVNLIKL